MILTAVVHLVETVVGLGSDISDLNTREGLMVIKGAKRDHKDVSAIIFTLNKDPGLYDGMGTKSTQTTDPPLGSRERCAVDLPLVSLLDKSGSGLELGQVGSVAQLCLGVASDDLELFCGRDPLFDLLLGSLRCDDRDEGAVVQHDLLCTKSSTGLGLYAVF